MFWISNAVYCNDAMGRELIRKTAEKFFMAKMIRLEAAIRQFIADNPSIPLDEIEIQEQLNDGSVRIARKEFR